MEGSLNLIEGKPLERKEEVDFKIEPEEEEEEVVEVVVLEE